jgi:hypothetical protein
MVKNVYKVRNVCFVAVGYYVTAKRDYYRNLSSCSETCPCVSCGCFISPQRNEYLHENGRKRPKNVAGIPHGYKLSYVIIL